MKNDKISPENRDLEKRLKQMSPFEIKNRLIEMAQTDARNSTATFLNAGRGNPNWIATEPREAFFLLGKFGLEECRRVTYNPVGIAGIPSEDGIGERFRKFLDYNKEERGAALISRTFEYLVSKHEFDPDILAHEFAEAVIGDQYPTPDRILKSAESMVRDYLRLAMGGGDDKSTYDLFATEGGTAGMFYAFDSIQENKLISKGDKMALMVPAFTPYIEIPHLDRFGFDVVNINADKVQHDGYHTWQYPKEEVDKLRDPSIKLLCVINPSNPPSYTLAPDTLQQLIDIVKNDNPNLMIITDDVYGTFVRDFHSLMYELPYNTMCVYSFSKYFGATGWRLAVCAINKDNVFDDMISRLTPEQTADLNRRYSSLSLDPQNIKFIDRMVADSRLVALNHTAGLSMPQQMQMTLMAAFAYFNSRDDNSYQTTMIHTINDRLNALWSTTGFTLLVDSLRAGYYSEIDIMVWAKKFYGDDFAKYLQDNYEPLDFVIRLASETAVVLLNGDGFDGPAWSVRVSLANLNESDYLKIGTAIRRMLDEYHTRYEAGNK
ncbi:bifunctional aspartate transaminase/aspartate 4-decarboxylase [uncultured Duncaniella sp.]|uniref:bifunctional aspartate transaminase/aspartate 4-decarboxylase n=1 Tax=uncultured Duncaniella sp. TaxID=2768039 RepID=UPI00265D5A37|nr:bifunctional aspartate transaminase/aspartate 4-decarboxylase [uncultured Duncaniella sp.]